MSHESPAPANADAQPVTQPAAQQTAQASRPIKSIGFIHLVPFDRNDPRKGHDEGVELFEYAEQLGLDSGWVRTRHMQHGLS